MNFIELVTAHARTMPAGAVRLFVALAILLSAACFAAEIPMRPTVPSATTLSAPTSQIAAWYRWALYQEQQVASLKAQLAAAPAPVATAPRILFSGVAVLPAFVDAGSKITWSVVADGTPAPTFQWLKNGENIPGATGSVFIIAAAVAGDSGRYNVRATNVAGSATAPSDDKLMVK